MVVERVACVCSVPLGQLGVSCTIFPPTIVICDVIAPGTVTIVLTRAANLGNPKAAGTYPLIVSRGAQQFKTLLKIT